MNNPDISNHWIKFTGNTMLDNLLKIFKNLLKRKEIGRFDRRRTHPHDYVILKNCQQKNK